MKNMSTKVKNMSTKELISYADSIGLDEEMLRKLGVQYKKKMKYYATCPKCGTTKEYHCHNCGHEVFECEDDFWITCNFCDSSEMLKGKCNECGLTINQKFWKIQDKEYNDKKQRKKQKELELLGFKILGTLVISVVLLFLIN